jgi:aspartyl-tRNA(Asn)/glutamyl-tRNA(Gln) amidotransferase subunit A
MRRREGFGADLLSLVDQGRLVSATAEALSEAMGETWDAVNVVFTPTTPLQAPRIGQSKVGDEDVRFASTRFVRPFNVLGLPALSIPCINFSLPAALRIVGPPSGEAGLLAAGESIGDRL